MTFQHHEQPQDILQKLNTIGSAQRERLAFIDFALYFLVKSHVRI